MKKLFSIVLCLALLAGVMTFASCAAKTAEIAIVTDVGQLMDKGFNQGTYEGAKAFAEEHKISYKYYQPSNGSDATDNDRIAAMKQAINNGAKIIVAPGFLQAKAMRTVAMENPDVKFVFIDGWNLTDKVDDNGGDIGSALLNVTAVTYKEEESGFLAGYAAVMEGYTKLGYTGGGGGSNPACNRFGYGFVQGAEAAAKEKNVDVTINYSYKFGEAFSASPELQTQIAGWYAQGVEAVFACGGSMFNSVKSAAAEYPNAKIIGVDVDQSGESSQVITSAVKGLATSVKIVLGQFYDGKWDAELGGKSQNLGAAEDATGLPTESWRLTNFTIDQYNALFAKIKSGEITPDSSLPSNGIDSDEFLKKDLTKVTIVFEK
ncbi:MAG: BMP family ABC transporter substrate-binding protein [Eubacteriales bacterium]|nr:BMP family ABC transporter substrate-binding protein [Clostridiales bacterium]MDY5859495.1 BMP family ABC transporter substrate-binding protein [Eubacteriales bacterium]